MTKVILDYDKVKKKKKNKSLLDQLDEMEDVRPVSISSNRPKKKEKSKEEEDTNPNGDEWLETISTFKSGPMVSKARRGRAGFFDTYDSGKKKKKKKKKEEAIDYATELEPETHILRNLLQEQIKFTDSLQKRYDLMTNSKTAARGVGKFTTDLISSINQARSESRQLVSGIISTKKTIAELNMKERKERAGIIGEDGENLSAFSSRFLQQVLKESRKDLSAYGDAAPVEGTDDDIFDNISLQLTEEEQRSDEVDKFLKYEKRNPRIVAVVDSDTEEYHLEAIAGDNGEILEDYPLPEIESLSINRSTNIATDDYHSKYPIEWR